MAQLLDLSVDVSSKIHQLFLAIHFEYHSTYKNQARKSVLFYLTLSLGNKFPQAILSTKK